MFYHCYYRAKICLHPVFFSSICFFFVIGELFSIIVALINDQVRSCLDVDTDFVCLFVCFICDVHHQAQVRSCLAVDTESGQLQWVVEGKIISNRTVQTLTRNWSSSKSYLKEPKYLLISEGANHLLYHLLRKLILNHLQNHRGKPFVQRKAWKFDWPFDSRDEQRSLGMVRQE